MFMPPGFGGLPGRIKNRNRGIGIQLSNTWCSNCCSRLSNIIKVEEELGGEVCDGGGGRVVKSQTLDTRQSNILCDLNTESLESNNKYVRRTHTLHSLVSEHI